MRTFVPAFAALLAFSCTLQPARAHADTFNFSLSSTGSASTALTASGTLTTVTDPNNASLQVVTGLTGTAQNGALTGDFSPVSLSLIPVTPGTVNTLTFSTQNSGQFYLIYDNVLDPNSSNLFDGNGLAFLSSDNVSYVVGFNGSSLVYEAFNNDLGFDQRTFGDNNVPLEFSLSPAATAVTPEPTSIALLGTGFLGLAGLVRRRRSA